MGKIIILIMDLSTVVQTDVLRKDYVMCKVIILGSHGVRVDFIYMETE